VPSLLETQRAMQASLIAGDDRAMSTLLSAGVNPDRINIYRNTFRMTMIKALRLTYPVVLRLVGEEFFEAIGQLFATRYPPTIAYLDQCGGGFAEFLRTFEPATSLSYLPDVARLEWAINCALHAPDESPLDLQELAAIPAEDHRRICFVAHPSVQLLRLDYPADSIWRAIVDDGGDAALASINLEAGPVRLLVERREAGVTLNRLEQKQWQLAERLLSGSSLDDVLGEADGIDASEAIADHLASGRFISFALTAHELISDSNHPKY